MKALARFVTLGAQDADRRVAALLAPRSFDDASAYLTSSATLRFADRITRRLQGWWLDSKTCRALHELRDTWFAERWRARYQAIGTVVLTATAVHVTLTLFQGPRPGWFWMMIPATALVFGGLLLVAASSSQSPN